MKATKKKRDTARDFLSQIETETVTFEHGIEDAVLDDWTDGGSFQACVVLKTQSRRKPYKIDTNLRRLTPAIKRAASEIDKVSLTRIDHPEIVRRYVRSTQETRTKGHQSTVTMVHFDVI